MREISEEQKERGELGENVIYKKFSYLISNGGFILHSYTYPMTQDLPGNIKKVNDKPQVCPPAENTEIDILIVTKNYVYPVEVKTYKGLIKIGQYGISRPNGYVDDKSPIHQNEMHARHLYDQIYFFLPKGNHKYIKPLVIFTDKCNIEDRRPDKEINYIPAFIINNAVTYMNKLEKSASGDIIDIKNLYKKLMEIGSCKKEMKVW